MSWHEIGYSMFVETVVYENTCRTRILIWNAWSDICIDLCIIWKNTRGHGLKSISA